MDLKTEVDGVEPGSRKFLDGLVATTKPKINLLTPIGARMFYEELAQMESPAGTLSKKACDFEDRTLHVDFRGDIRIRIVRPQESVSQKLPVAMYFHGGGWILGSTDTHDRIMRDLAHGAQCALFFVDYDRSPEVQYPVAIEQAYEATKCVFQNAKELNVDPKRIALIGDGVGGNMATVVSILAKKRKGPKIAKQILFYPVTDSNFLAASYDQFAEGYFLTRETMKWYWDNYLPDLRARAETTAAPLRATLDELSGVAPALITTNEYDVVRDEGEAYARKLAIAGVPVTAVRMLGMIHDNLILGDIADSPGARAATELAIAHLRAAFASA